MRELDLQRSREAMRRLTDRRWSELKGFYSAAARYSADDLTDKASCPADLLERLGFNPADESAVIGIIGSQNGFVLIHESAARPRATVPTLMSRLARFVWRTGADHVTTVDGGADAPMRLLPEAITLALLLALGRQ
jgi:hypothetical protein